MFESTYGVINYVLSGPDNKPVIMFVHGDKDLKFLIKAGNRWHERTAHAKRMIIEDAGHVTTGDQPKIVNEAIDAFIQNIVR